MLGPTAGPPVVGEADETVVLPGRVKVPPFGRGKLRVGLVLGAPVTGFLLGRLPAPQDGQGLVPASAA